MLDVSSRDRDKIAGLGRAAASSLTVHRALIDTYPRKLGTRSGAAKRPGSRAYFDQEAVRQMLKHEIGVLCAPTAVGKTITAAAMIARRKISTLVMVHRTELLRQWVERLTAFLELPEESLGAIGGGKHKPTGKIDIAVMQSLSKRDDLPQLLDGYGQVIIDECHDLSAVSFVATLKRARAKYVMGLTATPVRRDGHYPIIFMQSGPIRHTAPLPESAPKELEVYPRFLPAPEILPDDGLQELFRRVADDSDRTTVIEPVACGEYRQRLPEVTPSEPPTKPGAFGKMGRSSRDAVLLDLSRLARLLGYSERHAFLSVEPGVSFRDARSFPSSEDIPKAKWAILGAILQSDRERRRARRAPERVSPSPVFSAIQ